MDQLANMGITEINSATATLAISIVLCLSFLKIAMHVGRYVNFVDKPTARKKHVGNIPLVGGVSIYLTFLTMQLLTPPVDTYLITAATLLLLVGMVDDFRELGPKFRLLIQGGTAGLMVVGANCRIEDLGAIFSANPVVLGGVVATVFSIFCIIGVINAINMIDGADCLAGGIVAVSVIGLLVVSIGDAESVFHLDSSLLAILGATLAFLAFNSGLFGMKQKVFLGDSGSMFLGLLLASYFITMSQGPEASLSPVVAGWIFGLPLMDSIAVMVGRVAKGRSPLKAGRDHLHHLILDSGFSQKVCVSVMLLLHAGLVSIGLLGNHYDFSMPAMFWAFVALVIAHFAITPKLVLHLHSAIIRGPQRASN